MLASICGFRISAIEIIEEMWPRLLGFADYKMVTILLGFICQECNMWSTHHHFSAVSFEPQRNSITMTRIWRVDRDRDEIKSLPVRNALIIFIHKGDFVFSFINKTCQIWHGDLDEVVELFPAVSVNLFALRGYQ